LSSSIYFQYGSGSYAHGDIIPYPGNHGLKNLSIPAFNTWNHVVIVWDFVLRTDEVYINGVADYMNINNITADNSFTSFIIGTANKNDPNQFYTGALDDIRIYNRTLNASEINSLYLENIHDTTPVVITKQPASAVVKFVGGTATFSVTATGTDRKYQWYKNGDAGLIANATDSSYTINSVQLSDSGLYYCEIQNEKYSIQTNYIHLTVKPALSVIKTIDEVSVFPNPTNGIVNIPADIIKVEVFDVIGNIKGAYNNTKQIDIGVLPTGVYILNLYSIDGFVREEKIVKDH